jgi:hypothetical protein
MKSIKVIVPILALLAVCLFYWPKQPTYIPKKLWGAWQTDHELYAGRYLDISEAIFTIGQGQQQLQVFFVHRVKMDIVGHRERYTLFYREHIKNKEPLQTFTFFFQKTKKGDRLQLSNQGNILWHREADDEPTASAPETPAP